MQWSATSLHESGHWARWHGTTIGSLLTCLSAAFTFTATDMLQTEDYRKRLAAFGAGFLKPSRLGDVRLTELLGWQESLCSLKMVYRLLLDGVGGVRSPV